MSGLRRIAGRALLALGWVALTGGLLWMIWLPVFGDFRGFFLPLAVAWTGCIIGAIGAWVS